MKIGETWYKVPIYVAPIDQDMLFGLDMLHRGSAVLDMGNSTLIFNGYEIGMNMGCAENVPLVARVTVAKRRVIPPQSVALVQCNMAAEMLDYVVEPCGEANVFGPRVFRRSGSDPIVCVVNTANSYKLLKKGQEVGRACRADIACNGPAEEGDPGAETTYEAGE